MGTWHDERGFDLGEDLRRRSREGLAAVAGWAARNQRRHAWPRWSAESGRFPYHVHLPTDDTFLSTSWNTARMVQGLLGAWQVLGDAETLATAERGLEYVKSLQFFGPEAPELHGMFFAETPLSDHCPNRDGVECAQALIAHHLVTRDAVSLLRARAFLDRLLARMDGGQWPAEDVMLVPRLAPNRFLAAPWAGLDVMRAWCVLAAAIPFVQLAAATGEERYVAAARRLGELILAHIMHGDGSLRAPDSGHHTSTPEGFLDNDDGLLLALVALWRRTGERRWLDAAVANGDWWLARLDRLPANHTTVLLLAMNFADLARASGEARFADALRALAPQVLAAQIRRDTRPLVAGAFLGEDMARHYRAGSASGDFISLRTTSYGALALGHLACPGAAAWNPSYSAFGW